MHTLRHSIKAKIACITLVITFVITIFTAAICFFTSQTLLTQSLSQSTGYSLQLIMNTFSNNTESIVSLTHWIRTTDSIERYLTTDSASLRTTALVTWQKLREEYLNNPSSKYIERIVVANDRKHYLHLCKLTSPNAFHVPDSIREAPYFDKLYHTEEITLADFGADPFNYYKPTILPVVAPIISLYSEETVGWLFMAVSSDILMDSLKEYTIPPDSKLYLTTLETTYEIRGDKFIALDTSPFSLSTNKEENLYTKSKFIDANGKKQTLISVDSSVPGWTLSQTLSQTQLIQQKNLYQLLILLICIIVPALGISLAFYIQRLLQYPLGKIQQKIEAISQGDFSYDASIEWDNELGTIGKGINTLSKDVTHLMDARLQHEKERRDLEYQVLQSQVNPHFLYNTLNSIKWMATIQRATGIAEMTTSLSLLLKSISKDTKQLVPLAEEIALLDHYFLIQKYRYGGTLTLTYDIPDDAVKRYLLPKFTLQPIVENAIFHGIESKGEAGHIDIAIEATNGILQIQVTDNGIGMTQEQMDQLLTKNDQSKTEFFKQIGISNVHQRIGYTFGSQYGLSFSSTLGHHTTVTITLPCTTHLSLS